MVHINLIDGKRFYHLRKVGRCEPITTWCMGVRTYTPMQHRVLTKCHGEEMGDIYYMYVTELCVRCKKVLSQTG